MKDDASQYRLMSEAEMLAAIARILRGEGEDEEFGEWIEALERSIPCPHVLNLIRNAEELDTPELILKKARDYKPFRL